MIEKTDRNAAIMQMKESGLGSSEIARRLSMTRQRVHQVLVELGYKPNDRKRYTRDWRGPRECTTCRELKLDDQFSRSGGRVAGRCRSCATEYLKSRPEYRAAREATRLRREILLCNVRNLHAAGKTQTQIAEALGTSQAQISRLLRREPGWTGEGETND